MKKEMMDVMMLGNYDDYKVVKKEFKKSVKKKFDNVKLGDLEKSESGYFFNVYAKEINRDNYYAWLLGTGWAIMSMEMKMVMIYKHTAKRFNRLLKLAKKQYPDSFKKPTSPE